ncbi:MAG: FtsQ-type POTRA domain-containing protein [Oscillospiraceae bacterium]|nr:FtsQ-type POTRA domain-containing protein [Oscillospiraceae bacterium]
MKRSNNPPNNTAGRKKRRRGTGKKTLHIFLLSVFFLGAGFVLSLTVLFRIEAVLVLGSDKYAAEDLALDSGVSAGDNLLRVSSGRVRSALMDKYPYIESVELRRKVPSTIEIHITQCSPGGALKQGDDYILITKDGKALERGMILIPENIPLVIGMDAGDILPGEYLQNSRDNLDEQETARAQKAQEALLTLRYLFDAMDESGFTDITNLDITDPLNIKIMYENRLLIELGSEADLPYKLEFVGTIIRDNLEPDARGIIHAGNARSRQVIVTPG